MSLVEKKPENTDPRTVREVAADIYKLVAKTKRARMEKLLKELSRALFADHACEQEETGR